MNSSLKSNSIMKNLDKSIFSSHTHVEDKYANRNLHSMIIDIGKVSYENNKVNVVDHRIREKLSNPEPKTDINLALSYIAQYKKYIIGFIIIQLMAKYVI